MVCLNFQKHVPSIISSELQHCVSTTGLFRRGLKMMMTESRERRDQAKRARKPCKASYFPEGPGKKPRSSIFPSGKLRLSVFPKSTRLKKEILGLNPSPEKLGLSRPSLPSKQRQNSSRVGPTWPCLTEKWKWLHGVLAQACPLGPRTLGDSPKLLGFHVHRECWSSFPASTGFCEGWPQSEMGGKREFEEVLRKCAGCYWASATKQYQKPFRKQKAFRAQAPPGIHLGTGTSPSKGSERAPWSLEPSPCPVIYLPLPLSLAPACTGRGGGRAMQADGSNHRVTVSY